ncbi:MAG: PIN domain-containing protein [Acidobacteria bacterium]|nr:PIN domain-containing protein [Acidobacteriota bacterium]
MGFLRLLTNRHVMGDEVQSVDGAWGIYWKLREDSRVHFVREAPVMGEGWNSLRKHRAAGPNSWTDAYLLAFARSHGCNIVTFDRAFPTAEPVQTIVLTA